MSAVISVGGRCQFSCENANRESSSSPTATAPSTTSRTARIPDRCPNGRGMRRSRAQRPFPSMMIAIEAGVDSREPPGPEASEVVLKPFCRS